ncbi:MAG: hypothetical protein LUC88_10465 [Prevotella sp.]|nr:hypothetical protein [Prevotella sp.]
MNLNNISLPYPVLGISDDIKTPLPPNDVVINLEKDKSSFTFHVYLDFDNLDIHNLIENGYAEYTCEYECSSTMLRKCVKSVTPKFTIKIQSDDVNGRIYFNCFVSVKKTIEDYINIDFNPDYDGYSFRMDPGDILVAFRRRQYDVDINYNKLLVAGSIMQILENNKDEYLRIDTQDSKISIQLPTKLYNQYCDYDSGIKNKAAILHSSIVMNALTYALLELSNKKKTDNIDEDARLWVRTICYRLKHDKGLSLEDLDEIDNIPIVAQKLLGKPYDRLFEFIKDN